MSLRISDSTRKIFRAIGLLALLALIGCIIRIAVWEHFYYRDRQDAPRGVSTAPFEETAAAAAQPVDETEITPEVKQEYRVSADKPRYLTIDKLGVKNARILEVSANSGEAMGVPNNIFDVGWARTSGKPGQGGTSLLDAHNGGPNKDGIFKHLDSLQVGDIITVERGDGQLFDYGVYDTKILKMAEANAYMRDLQQSPVPGRESISVITCVGEWIQSARTYDSRVMLRAVLLQ